MFAKIFFEGEEQVLAMKCYEEGEPCLRVSTAIAGLGTVSATMSFDCQTEKARDDKFNEMDEEQASQFRIKMIETFSEAKNL